MADYLGTILGAVIGFVATILATILAALLPLFIEKGRDRLVSDPQKKTAVEPMSNRFLSVRAHANLSAREAANSRSPADVQQSENGGVAIDIQEPAERSQQPPPDWLEGVELTPSNGWLILLGSPKGCTFLRDITSLNEEELRQVESGLRMDIQTFFHMLCGFVASDFRHPTCHLRVSDYDVHTFEAAGVEFNMRWLKERGRYCLWAELDLWRRTTPQSPKFLAPHCDIRWDTLSHFRIAAVPMSPSDDPQDGSDSEINVLVPYAHTASDLDDAKSPPPYLWMVHPDIMHKKCQGRPVQIRLCKKLLQRCVNTIMKNLEARAAQSKGDANKMCHKIRQALSHSKIVSHSSPDSYRPSWDGYELYMAIGFRFSEKEAEAAGESVYNRAIALGRSSGTPKINIWDDALPFLVLGICILRAVSTCLEPYQVMQIHSKKLAQHIVDNDVRVCIGKLPEV